MWEGWKEEEGLKKWPKQIRQMSPCPKHTQHSDHGDIKSWGALIRHLAVLYDWSVFPRPLGSCSTRAGALEPVALAETQWALSATVLDGWMMDAVVQASIF